MRPISFLLGASLLWLTCLAGCATYEYDITQPDELAGHIGSKADVVLPRDPLEYRLISVENRLVMRIFNPTESPITLVGDRSSAVDGGGQSHPLPTQTMAPHSFIKLVLPPLRPRIESVGPYFGVGMGTGIAYGRRYGYGYGWEYPYYPYDYGPRYLTVYDGGEIYWAWNDESSVRLNLVFERQQPQGTFEQGFVIARKKM